MELFIWKFIFRQTVSEIGKALQQSSLSPDSQQTLLRALTQCASPTDAVHQLLWVAHQYTVHFHLQVLKRINRAQRIRTFWGRIMKDGKVPLDLKFINAARALVPRIEKVSSCQIKLRGWTYFCSKRAILVLFCYRRPQNWCLWRTLIEPCTYLLTTNWLARSRSAWNQNLLESSWTKVATIFRLKAESESKIALWNA